MHGGNSSQNGNSVSVEVIASGNVSSLIIEVGYSSGTATSLNSLAGGGGGGVTSFGISSSTISDSGIFITTGSAGGGVGGITVPLITSSSMTISAD